jgi:hypothetical protein
MPHLIIQKGLPEITVAYSQSTRRGIFATAEHGLSRPKKYLSLLYSLHLRSITAQKALRDSYWRCSLRTDILPSVD